MPIWLTGQRRRRLAADAGVLLERRRREEEKDQFARHRRRRHLAEQPRLGGVSLLGRAVISGLARRRARRGAPGTSPRDLLAAPSRAPDGTRPRDRSRFPSSSAPTTPAALRVLSDASVPAASAFARCDGDVAQDRRMHELVHEPALQRLLRPNVLGGEDHVERGLQADHACGSRCVPPAPGIRPSCVSGSASTVLG